MRSTGRRTVGSSTTPSHSSNIVLIDIMNSDADFTYYKRCRYSTSEPDFVLRHPIETSLNLKRWEEGSWVDAFDLWWDFVKDPDYIEISEKEAQSIIGFEFLSDIDTYFPVGAIAYSDPLTALRHAGYSQEQALLIVSQMNQDK